MQIGGDITNDDVLEWEHLDLRESLSSIDSNCFVQDYGIFSALAMEIAQPYTRPWIKLLFYKTKNAS